jgi:hypothetical protein
MSDVPAKFNPGPVVATAAVAHDTEASGQVAWCLARHLGGDWGGADDHLRADNDRNLAAQGGPLHSVYTLPSGCTLWIITDAIGEGPTTVLFPSDY